MSVNFERDQRNLNLSIRHSSSGSTMPGHQIHLSGPVMKEKAVDISQQLGIEDTSCSKGSLHRFKRRHSIAYRAMCSERRTVDEDSTDTWIDDVLKPTQRNYDSRNIFNTNETGLKKNFYQQRQWLLKQRSAMEEEKRRKNYCDCANMNGTETFSIMTIGKFQTPRCFKGVSLPVHNTANSKAWMTSELM